MKKFLYYININIIISINFDKYIEFYSIQLTIYRVNEPILNGKYLLFSPVGEMGPAGLFQPHFARQIPTFLTSGGFWGRAAQWLSTEPQMGPLTQKIPTFLTSGLGMR